MINPDYVILSSEHSAQLLLFYKDKRFSTGTPKNTVSISYINKRKIVINTTTGIKFFDPETMTFSELLFKKFSFTSAFGDKENNLWLTTAGSGVLMVPSLQFRNYLFSGDKENAEITALSIIGNTLYAAGWDKKLWKANTATCNFPPEPATSPTGAR